MSKSPPNLAEVIRQRVVNRTGRRVRDLTVVVGSGVVTLRGRVGSYHLKQLAQHAAREAFPDAKLENAIVVE